MNILLAGGAGYIGSHTAVELLSAGHSVVIVDDYSNSSPEAINRIEEITGKEASKVRTLYRVLQDIINEKACYELKCENYKEVEKYKGITRDEFEAVLNKIIITSDNYVKEANQLIKDSYKGFLEQTKLMKGISFVVIELNKNLILNSLKEKIIKYIDDNIDKLNDEFEEIVNKLLQEFEAEFPIEYSKYEKMALFILLLAKYKEDLNEQFNN